MPDTDRIWGSEFGTCREGITRAFTSSRILADPRRPNRPDPRAPAEPPAASCTPARLASCSQKSRPVDCRLCELKRL